MSTQATLKPSLRIDSQLPLFGELAVAKALKEQETIGARIARLRKDKGMTQTELAAALGVTQPVVSDYENDEIGLDSARIKQLAEILSESADAILGLERMTKREAVVKMPTAPGLAAQAGKGWSCCGPTRRSTPTT